MKRDRLGLTLCVSWIPVIVLAGCLDFTLAGVDDDDVVDDDDTGDDDTGDDDDDVDDDDTDDDDSAGDDDSADDDDTDEGINPDDATTTGTEHWLGFMENLDLAWNDEPEFEIFVLSTVDTSGEVRVPATGLSLPFSAQAGVTVVELPSGAWYPEGEEVADTGIQVVTDDPVDVGALHLRLYFSEASLALPLEELGHHYRVVTHPDESGSSPSQFLVVATADDTEVTITPSATTYGLHGAGQAFAVTMHSGQVYQVQSGDDLSGSLIDATERVAVFAGNREGRVQDCGATSHSWDVNLPLERWGTDYVVVPFEHQGGSTVKVVASQDDTHVLLDCAEEVVLQAGETTAWTVTDPARITADHPVGVIQLMLGGGCDGGPEGIGDPNMVVVPPVVLTRDSVWIHATDDARLTEGAGYPLNHHVGVAVALGGSAEVDGSAVALQPLGNGYLASSAVFSSGAHSLTGTGISAHAYGLSYYNAYTYSLGYDCIGCATDLHEPTVCP
jgi:hypothetical protein